MSGTGTTPAAVTRRETRPLVEIVNEVAQTTTGDHPWPVTLLLASGATMTGWAHETTPTQDTFVVKCGHHPDDETPPRHLLVSHVVGAWWADDAEHDRITGKSVHLYPHATPRHV